MAGTTRTVWLTRRAALVVVAAAVAASGGRAAEASYLPADAAYRTFDWIPRNAGWGGFSTMTFRPDGALLWASSDAHVFADDVHADGHIHLIRRPGEQLSERNRWGSPARNVTAFTWRRGELWAMQSPARACGAPRCLPSLVRLDPDDGRIVDGPHALEVNQAWLLTDPVTDALVMGARASDGPDGVQFMSYDVATRELTPLFRIPSPNAIQFSPDGRTVYGNVDYRIQAYDRTGRVIGRSASTGGRIGDSPSAIEPYYGPQSCLRGLLIYTDGIGNVRAFPLPLVEGEPPRSLATAFPVHNPAVDPVSVGQAVDNDGNYVGNDGSGAAAIGCANVPVPQPAPPPVRPRPAARPPAAPPAARPPGAAQRRAGAQVPGAPGPVPPAGAAVGAPAPPPPPVPGQPVPQPLPLANPVPGANANPLAAGVPAPEGADGLVPAYAVQPGALVLAAGAAAYARRRRLRTAPVRVDG